MRLKRMATATAVGTVLVSLGLTMPSATAATVNVHTAQVSSERRNVGITPDPAHQPQTVPDAAPALATGACTEAQLADAARRGEETAMCDGPADTASTPPQGGGSTGPGSAAVPQGTLGLVPGPDVPQWCRERAHDGKWWFLRTEACNTDDRMIELRTKIKGVWHVTGRVWYTRRVYAQSHADSLDWGVSFRMYPYRQWGVVQGWNASGTFACINRCSTTDQGFPQAPITTDVGGGGAEVRNTTLRSGQRVSSHDLIVVVYSSPMPNSRPSYVRLKTPDLRCDNALPGARAGCVFTQYTPDMVYDGNGPYPQLARHIRDAQRSGLPGAYPDGPVLNRTSPANATRNRTRSCPTGRNSPIRPAPAGTSCDEYPFASTQQGARTANPTTPPSKLRRTFDWCQMKSSYVKTGITGPRGYSICFIDAQQNSRGGSALETDLYRRQRILPPRSTSLSAKGDAFRVSIT